MAGKAIASDQKQDTDRDPAVVPLVEPEDPLWGLPEALVFVEDAKIWQSGQRRLTILRNVAAAAAGGGGEEARSSWWRRGREAAGEKPAVQQLP